MKREELFKVYSSLSKETINAAISCDPSSKDGVAGKYTKWILELARKGRWGEGDVYETERVLELFHKVKHTLPEDKRDIGKFKSVYNLLQILPETAENFKSIKETRKEGAEKVYEDDTWLVVVPHTKEAAQLYGKGTKWCTSAEKECMFDYYNKNGNLYININKKIGRKYQLYFKGIEYRNAKNKKISVVRFIERVLSKGAREYYKTKTIYKHYDTILSNIEFLKDSKHKPLTPLFRYRALYPLIQEEKKVYEIFNEKGEKVINAQIDLEYIRYELFDNSRVFLCNLNKGVGKIIDKEGKTLSNFSPIESLYKVDSNTIAIYFGGRRRKNGLWTLYNTDTLEFISPRQHYKFLCNALVLRKGKELPEDTIILSDENKLDKEKIFIYSTETKEVINISEIECVGYSNEDHRSIEYLGKDLILYRFRLNEVSIFDKKFREFICGDSDYKLILYAWNESSGWISEETDDHIIIDFSGGKRFYCNKKTGEYTLRLE